MQAMMNFSAKATYTMGWNDFKKFLGDGCMLAMKEQKYH